MKETSIKIIRKALEYYFLGYTPKEEDLIQLYMDIDEIGVV